MPTQNEIFFVIDLQYISNDQTAKVFGDNIFFADFVHQSKTRLFVSLVRLPYAQLGFYLINLLLLTGENVTA